MKFSRESAAGAKEAFVTAMFTPEEKNTIREWLEISLKLEFWSGSGHPLEGFIGLQMHGLDMERIIAARDALENYNPRQGLTRAEFGTLTRLADVWDEGQLAALDEKIRDNERFLAKDRYPEMRAYVESAAYQVEMKPFAGIVPKLSQARLDIYPHDRTIIEVDFDGKERLEG